MDNSLPFQASHSTTLFDPTVDTTEVLSPTLCTPLRAFFFDVAVCESIAWRTAEMILGVDLGGGDIRDILSGTEFVSLCRYVWSRSNLQQLTRNRESKVDGRCSLDIGRMGE